MRERLAKVIAALITALLVVLAAFFANRRNGAEPTALAGSGEAAPVPATALDPDLVARGRAVYEDQSCARCHAIEGRGNPRAPLDGVGARRSTQELRDWVTAAASVRSELSGSAQRAKDGFRQLPSTDLEALVTYLASLR